jgi:hypothetical protein
MVPQTAPIGIRPPQSVAKAARRFLRCLDTSSERLKFLLTHATYLISFLNAQDV